MAAQYKITEFFKGEGLHFTAALKDRDGSVIQSPASQTVTFRISNSEGGAPVVEFDASPQVVLTDETTGTWTFKVSPGDLSAVAEGALYYHNIWTELGSEDPILQVYGGLILGASIEAT